MPRTRECDYCGTDIEPGTGTMFVHKDGATTHFCSSKCENNADLGREARNLEWTDTARGEAGEVEDEAEEVDADEAEAEAEADEEADAEEAAADADEADADASADEDAEDEEAEEAEA
ncbi:LSU ribosomal protein L24E [Haloarcula vallismortis]|uniref:Large ribosomal subunit protein eL24 n=2 Tax=Haloarcula vallismortis TaxID=28442 RepID=M0JJ56_HALVA|nr:50S ribosomal protein L24e [Haloarcula vallismortis]EMA07740.1 50S ribosomal protein L24e/unknown domain fusion protein [Haloarcula vallismortis ATCC 29715]SDW72459.1 LSU ribosomal protein L24E [Haloarcula vallismortis]